MAGWARFLSTSVMVLVVCAAASATPIIWTDCTLVVEDAAGKTIQNWDLDVGHYITWDRSRFPVTAWQSEIYISSYITTPWIFRNIGLLDNVGRTIWIASDSDDPGYSAFASRLTHPLQMDALFQILVLRDKDGVFGLDGWGMGSRIDGSENLAIGKTVGRLGFRVNSVTSDLTPEPPGLLSLLTGLVGLALRLRRRSG